MDIRTYFETDKDAVIELWKACGLTRSWNDPEKDIDRKVQFQRDLFLVGIYDGKVIASAMAGYDGHRGSVFYLAVRPEFQAQGYGEKMMQHVERLLISIGCPKLNIVVRTSNTRVIGFYESRGYQKDDVVNIGKRLIEDA